MNEIMSLRTNREISSHQIHDLLATITHLQSSLRRTEADNKTDPNGEADTSIEATLIRACNRLDNILDDTERWKLPADGHAHFEALGKAQAQLVALQAELIKLQVFAGKFKQQMVLNDLLQSPSVPESERAMPTDEEAPPQQPKRKKKK